MTKRRVCYEIVMLSSFARLYRLGRARLATPRFPRRLVPRRSTAAGIMPELEARLRSPVSSGLAKGAWREERGTRLSLSLSLFLVLFVRFGETRRAQGSVHTRPPFSRQRGQRPSSGRASARAIISGEEPTAAAAARTSRASRNDVYVHALGRACVRACRYVRAYACLPPSMKYFHWFHGQQTRLHDANNTLHGAAVPFTSLASRSCGSSKKDTGRKSDEGGGREWEKERELDPEIVLRPARLALRIVDDRSTNFAKRHRSRWLQPWRVLTAGILKVPSRAARYSRTDLTQPQVGHVAMAPRSSSRRKRENVREKTLLCLAGR